MAGDGLPEADGLPEGDGLPEADGLPEEGSLAEGDDLPEADGLPEAHSPPQCQGSTGSEPARCMFFMTLLAQGLCQPKLAVDHIQGSRPLQSQEPWYARHRDPGYAQGRHLVLASLDSLCIRLFPLLAML